MDPFLSNRIWMALVIVGATAVVTALSLRQNTNVRVPAPAEQTAVEQNRNVSSSNNPQLVYSDNPSDPWNRIFYCLFTRTVKTQVSDEFTTGPFWTFTDGTSRVRVSRRTFERREVGDRAIGPLYPSFFTQAGVLQVLTDPLYSELNNAITQALAEPNRRASIARAMMQNDAWAAYDILFETKSFVGAEASRFSTRRQALLSILGRFVTKLSLSAEEIRLLPDNYAQGAARLDLPNAFAPDSEWLEVQLSPQRLHDFAADFRKSARVFLKPIANGTNKKDVLEKLRVRSSNDLIDSVMLLTQNMLIDANGDVVPTHLTSEVQIRRFVRDEAGRLIRTDIHQLELSRKSVQAGRDGFFEVDGNADLYFPSAGNDYRFASPQFSRRGAEYPVLVSLRQRCQGCHGPNVTHIFTLSSHMFPLPPIKLLNPRENAHGWYVAGCKEEREDFKSLRN